MILYCSNVETIPLQSSPVSILRINNFLTDSEKQYFKEYTNYFLEKDEDRPFISNTSTLLECSELFELKNKFNNAVKIYVQEVLHIPDMQFRLIGSWFTKNTLNSSHHSHSHPNSMLSVVTYFDDNVNKEDHIQGIVFEQNKLSSIFPEFKFKFENLKPDSWNIFNYERYTIKPKHNDVIIFPSHLNHRSEINTTESRFCIGANYFISGELQGNSILSHIKL
jgi:uncharacterized protein (TIGR02466 family)